MRTEIQAVGIALQLAPQAFAVELIKVARKIAEAARTLAEAGSSAVVCPFASSEAGTSAP